MLYDESYFILSKIKIHKKKKFCYISDKQNVPPNIKYDFKGEKLKQSDVLWFI